MITVPITGLIKTVAEGVYIFYLHDAGVDIYTEAGYHANLLAAGILCGDVSSAGLYIGTATGVYELTAANIALGGDLTASVTLFKASPDLLSNTITDVAARDTKVAVSSSAGVDLFYAGATRYSFTHVSGCSNVTFDAVNLFFSLDDTANAYYLVYPVANWILSDCLLLMFDPPGDALVLNDRNFADEDVPNNTITAVYAYDNCAVAYDSTIASFLIYEVDTINKTAYKRNVQPTSVPIAGFKEMDGAYFLSVSGDTLTLWLLNTVSFTVTQLNQFVMTSNVYDWEYAESGQLVVTLYNSPWIKFYSRSGSNLVEIAYTVFGGVTGSRRVAIAYASSGLKLYFGSPSGPGGARILAYRLSGMQFGPMTVPNSDYIQTVNSIEAYKNKVIVSGSSTSSNATNCLTYNVGSTALTYADGWSGQIVDTCSSSAVTIRRVGAYISHTINTFSQPSSAGQVVLGIASGNNFNRISLPIKDFKAAAFGADFLVLALNATGDRPGLKFLGIPGVSSFALYTDPAALNMSASFLVKVTDIQYCVMMIDNHSYYKGWLFEVSLGKMAWVGQGGPGGTTANNYAWILGTSITAYSGSSQSLYMQVTGGGTITQDVAPPWYSRDIVVFGDYFLAHIPTTTAAALGGYDINGTAGTRMVDVVLPSSPKKMIKCTDADYVLIHCTTYLVLAERIGTSMTVHHELPISNIADIAWDTFAGYIVVTHADPLNSIEFFTVVNDVLTPAVLTGDTGLNNGAGQCRWHGNNLLVAGPANTPAVPFVLDGTTLKQIRPAGPANGNIVDILGIDNFFIVATDTYPYHYYLEAAQFAGEPVENVLKLEADTHLLMADADGLYRFTSLPVNPYTDTGWEPALHTLVVEVPGITNMSESHASVPDQALINYSGPTGSGIYSVRNNDLILTRDTDEPIWVADDGAATSIGNVLEPFPADVAFPRAAKLFIDRVPRSHAYSGPVYQISDLVWFLTSQTWTADLARKVAGPETNLLTEEVWDVAFLRRFEMESLILDKSVIGVDTVYTKLLNLTGTVVKILPYEGDDLIVYITTTSIYAVTLSTKAIFSWATIAATCGCGNETIIYAGTATTGVHSITLADMLIAGDRTAQLVLEVNAASGTPIQSNNVQDIDIFVNAMVIATDAGADYFYNWAGRLKAKYTVASIVQHCGVGQSWFALDVNGAVFVFDIGITADFNVADDTNFAALDALVYDEVNQIEFENSLFFATEKGVYCYDFVTTVVKHPAIDTEVITMYPTPMATPSTGGLVIGTTSASGEGRIEVIDLGA